MSPANSKNDACFRSGEKRLKNNHQALLVKIRDTGIKTETMVKVAE